MAVPTPIPLHSLAQARGIEIGAAVRVRPLRTEPLYAETLRREFNLLTPEVAMKWKYLRPNRDTYSFDDADTIVDFAIANGMTIRGHTLVWDVNLPRWLVNGNFTSDQLTEILREHIYTVVGRYRGRVAVWDVVNEAVATDGSLKDTFWLRGIGPQYIELAFRWAREADPTARLFYNDAWGEGLGRKSDGIYNLVKDLLARGVPIHGVGLQMHMSLGDPRRPEDVKSNMNRLAKLGLEIHVTEMTVKLKEPVTEETLMAQAMVYRDVLTAALSVKNFKAFVLWGFTDKYSSIPGRFPGHGASLMLDENYRPKPAYTAVRDVLAGAGLNPSRPGVSLEE